MTTDDLVILSYSRKQAIEDGVLIDVTETAKEAGFRYPAAMTSAAWATCVAVPEGVACQDEAGRLWDVLWMLRHAIRTSPVGGSVLTFVVLVRNDEAGPEPVALKAVCGPDDDAAPCLTVMLPEED